MLLIPHETYASGMPNNHVLGHSIRALCEPSQSSLAIQQRRHEGPLHHCTEKSYLPRSPIIELESHGSTEPFLREVISDGVVAIVRKCLHTRSHSIPVAGHVILIT